MTNLEYEKDKLALYREGAKVIAEKGGFTIEEAYRRMREEAVIKHGEEHLPSINQAEEKHKGDQR